VAAAAPFPWRFHAKLIAALWIWVLLPYANSFRTGFPTDNTYIILKDTSIRAATWQNVEQILTKDYWHATFASNLYRPLTTLTYLFNYAVLGNGTHAAAYHWVNFALHAINVALVYFLGLALLHKTVPAFGLAAIWGVHPALTESVTNIVGRADLLAGFGVLAALLCHIRTGREAGWRKAVWLSALAAAAAIGIFSKESAIVVLAAMAIYDLAFPAWRQRAWGYAAAALPVLLFLYIRTQVLADHPVGLPAFIDNPLVAADFWTARLTAVRVIGKYLWLLVWPVRLSADYSYNQIPVFAWHFRTWGDWATLVTLAISGVSLVLALLTRRRSPALFFFILMFFAALAPTSNVFLLIGTIMAERFLYLPAICLAGCLALGIGAVAGRMAPTSGRVFTVAAMVSVSLCFAGRTFARNFDWLNDHTLWTAAAEAAPDSYKPYNGLAAQALAAKPPDLDAAAAATDRELAVLNSMPVELGSARPYATAGSAYRKKGDAANSAAEKAVWYRKGLAALERGQQVDRFEGRRIEAMSAARGERVRSGWDPLYLDLGLTYLRLDDPKSAVDAFAYGRSLSTAPEFFEQMSHAYRALGDRRQAAISLLEGLVYDPSWTGFASQLADLYKETEPGSCALRQSGNGESLDLACPLVHDELCTASRNIQRLHVQRAEADKAGAIANSAVRELGCPAELFR
jgi:tetratricopeptide (TPR) repeat protein